MEDQNYGRANSYFTYIFINNACVPPASIRCNICKIQFDFLVVYKEKQFYDDEIEKLGGKIYRMSFREDLNLFKFQKDLRKFFDEHNEYKIVHCHAYTTNTLFSYLFYIIHLI